MNGNRHSLPDNLVLGADRNLRKDVSLVAFEPDVRGLLAFPSLRGSSESVVAALLVATARAVYLGGSGTQEHGSHRGPIHICAQCRCEVNSISGSRYSLSFDGEGDTEEAGQSGVLNPTLH
jgi:hypothetical protein